MPSCGLDGKFCPDCKLCIACEGYYKGEHREPEKKPQRSVLQDWVMELPLMQQSVLITAIRGCDGLEKNDKSKPLHRCLRAVILVNARDESELTESSFMFHFYKDKLWVRDIENQFRVFLTDMDKYPLHYWLHLTHAIEIIGYKHPDEDIRAMWCGFYMSIADAMHLNPELPDQLDRRLNK